jgi:hypothetical protein
VDRSRNIVMYCAIAIAVDGIAVCDLQQATELARLARSSVSAAVPVTVAVATKHDLPVHVIGLGSVQAFFSNGIRSLVEGKPEAAQTRLGYTLITAPSGGRTRVCNIDLGDIVRALKSENLVEADPIKGGPTTAGRTAVTSGLSEAERLIVNTEHKLRLNLRVTANEREAPAGAKQDRSS